MTIMIKIAGILMLLFGLYIVIMNWAAQFQNYRNKKKGIEKFISPVPFVGPIFICMGYEFAGFSFTWFVFLSFLLDPGTVITIISLPWLFMAFLSHKGEK